MVVALICFAQKSTAQTNFGVSLGSNFSSIRYSDANNRELIKEHKKIKTGLNAGLFIRQNINPIIIVGSDLEYSRKGLKYNQQGLKKGKIKLNYLTWSAMGYINASPKKRWRLYPGIGIYSSFMINGKFTHTLTKTGEKTTKPIDFKSNNYEYTRWDAGLQLAIIMTLKNTPWELMLAYQHGMIESSKRNADSFKNRNLKLVIQYNLSSLIK